MAYATAKTNNGKFINAGKNADLIYFNGSIIKYTKKLVNEVSEKGKELKYIFVGKKAYLSLKRFCGDSILEQIQDYANPTIKFELAGDVRDKILKLFMNNEISECHLIYTEFKSAISQTVKSQKEPG